MAQAFGMLLILLGAIMFHIASADSHISSPIDVWKDMLKVMNGAKIA